MDTPTFFPTAKMGFTKKSSKRSPNVKENERLWMFLKTAKSESSFINQVFYYGASKHRPKERIHLVPECFIIFFICMHIQ